MTYEPKGFSQIKMTPEGSHVYSIFAAGPSWDIREFLPPAASWGIREIVPPGATWSD